MNNQDQFQSIASGLENVHGGGKLKAAWDGAKQVYKAIRPPIKETAEVTTDLIKIGAGGVAAREGYKYVTGEPSKLTPPTEQTQPTQPATDTE